MGAAIDKPFHLKRWLNVSQAVDHLSAISEEPLTSADLADLAENLQLDLYWYRPGQKLAYTDSEQAVELTEPLRLSPDNHSDWQAITGILRNRPALPAAEDDTPLLEDRNGRRLRITFERSRRPEPFSSRWYPSFAELMLKRSDIDRLEARIFSEGESTEALEPHLLLNVIWQLEQMALDDGRNGHDTAWLTEQLAARDNGLDRHALERVLAAAEREGSLHHSI